MLWFLLVSAILVSYVIVFVKGMNYGVHVEYQRQYQMFNGVPTKK
jgi:preprotein translocase subunit SecY